MDDACLLDAELDLAGLRLADRLAHVERDRAHLGVGHETTRTEHATETTDLTHHVRRRNHDVELQPTFRDLGDHVVGADVVGSRSGRLVRLVTLREDEHPVGFAGAVRQHDRTTDHLVRMLRIDAEPHRDVDALVELRECDSLHEGAGFLDRVALLPIDTLDRGLALSTCFHRSSLPTVPASPGRLADPSIRSPPPTCALVGGVDGFVRRDRLSGLRASSGTAAAAPQKIWCCRAAISRRRRRPSNARCRRCCAWPSRCSRRSCPGSSARRACGSGLS
jgi:hypothetical protein